MELIECILIINGAYATVCLFILIFIYIIYYLYLSSQILMLLEYYLLAKFYVKYANVHK